MSMKTVKSYLSDQTQSTDFNSNEMFSEHFLQANISIRSNTINGCQFKWNIFWAFPSGQTQLMDDNSNEIFSVLFLSNQIILYDCPHTWMFNHFLCSQVNIPLSSQSINCQSIVNRSATNQNALMSISFQTKLYYMSQSNLLGPTHYP